MWKTSGFFINLYIQVRINFPKLISTTPPFTTGFLLFYFLRLFLNGTSFKCELQENLQNAMKNFVEEHPNWDQYRILQTAIAGFLMQKGFQNRDLTRLYVGNMFSMNFDD